MITNQALVNQRESGNGQEPVNMQRRILMGSALAALLVSPRSIMADDGEDTRKRPTIRLSFYCPGSISLWLRVRDQNQTLV